MISTGGILLWGGFRRAADKNQDPSLRFGMTMAFGWALVDAQQYGLPVGTMTPLSAHADTEDKKLRKDPFGGPCFEGTLRILAAFRMKSRGRDN
jgi:hypothetical protein